MGETESLGSAVNNQTTNVTPITAGRGSGSNGDSGNYGERLARIEAKMEYFATKEDIQKIKVWVLVGVLGGILGGMGIATTLTVSIVKLFFSN